MDARPNVASPLGHLSAAVSAAMPKKKGGARAAVPVHVQQPAPKVAPRHVQQRTRRPSKALSSDRLRGAAARGDEQVATRELEKGAEVDEEDEQTGCTALMEAAEACQPALVELLVRANASVDRVDARGWTALMKASKLGHIEVVRCLLLARADPAVAADDGRTAAEWAAMGGHDEVQQLIEAAVGGELPAPRKEPVQEEVVVVTEPEPDPKPAADGASEPEAPASGGAHRGGLQREVQQLQQRLTQMQAQVLRMDAAATASAATSASAGALQYVGQLSERLAHVEAATESNESLMLEEIERLEQLGEEQAEELSITAQMDKALLHSNADMVQARLNELTVKLSQVQGVVQNTTSDMGTLRLEFEAVRDTSEESSITQAMELAAVRAATEVEREARQFECSELTADGEALSQLVGGLRDGLGLSDTPGESEADLNGGRAALAAFLAAVELSHYLEVLEEVLGAAMIEDLLEMEEEDFDELGLKRLERRRLMRAIDKLRAAAGLPPREVRQSPVKAAEVEDSPKKVEDSPAKVEESLLRAVVEAAGPEEAKDKAEEEVEVEEQRAQQQQQVERQLAAAEEKAALAEKENADLRQRLEKAEQYAEDSFPARSFIDPAQEREDLWAEEDDVVPAMNRTMVGGGVQLGAVPLTDSSKPKGYDKSRPESPQKGWAESPERSGRPHIPEPHLHVPDVTAVMQSPIRPQSPSRGRAHKSRAEYHSPRHSVAGSDSSVASPTRFSQRGGGSPIISPQRSRSRQYVQQQVAAQQQLAAAQQQQLAAAQQQDLAVLQDLDDDWLGLDALSMSVSAAVPTAARPANPSKYYESEDFVGFLAEMRLETFAVPFMEHGYDDIAVLRELPEQQLDELLLDVGMAQGHAARFRLGLRSAREQPIGLSDLGELRVSATAHRAAGSGDDIVSLSATVVPKVFRMSMETPLQEFVDKLARVLRLGSTEEVVELTYDDGIDADVIIIDEQDFTDAKAVAAKDAGCRLEMCVELLSLETAEALRQERLEEQRQKELEREDRHRQMLEMQHAQQLEAQAAIEAAQATVQAA